MPCTMPCATPCDTPCTTPSTLPCDAPGAHARADFRIFIRFTVASSGHQISSSASPTACLVHGVQTWLALVRLSTLIHGHARHVSVRIHIYTRFFTYHETQQVLTPEQTSTIFMPFTVASLVRCHRTFDRTFNQSNVRSNLPSNVPSSVALNIHRGERVQLARAEHPARPTSGAM